MGLFSQRQAKPVERFDYAVPERTRLRILHTLRQMDGGFMPRGMFRIGRLLMEVGDLVLAKSGVLKGNVYLQVNEATIATHFGACTDDEALDFIELCFQTNEMCGENPQSTMAVAAINQIFEEEGIGYELTQFSQRDTGRPAELFGRYTGGNFIQTVFPQIVKKDERTVHELAVKPALHALHDIRFATANSELLNAFAKVRSGDYADAITSCGAAFESVLKTICDAKGWPYAAAKGCADLVEICRSSGLFFPFYVTALVGVGTIRNKLGDAHGKGPAPEYVAAREHAEHMISLTCSHITFVVRQAGL